MLKLPFWTPSTVMTLGTNPLLSIFLTGSGAGLRV
jgi:hypothetical protein